MAPPQKETLIQVWYEWDMALAHRMAQEVSASQQFSEEKIMNVFDRNKIDEITMALLYLNRHQPSHNRAWKGIEWETLDRLYEKGWIDDPKNAAKSVSLTEEGLRQSEQLFWHSFGMQEEHSGNEKSSMSI